MIKSKLLIAALAFSSLGALSVPASAAVGIYVDIAPPAPRYEVVPAARPGYVWQPGYWDWRHNRHSWVNGYWVKERPGMYWHPNRWEQHDGRWVLERGTWDRQRWADNATAPIATTTASPTAPTTTATATAAVTGTIAPRTTPPLQNCHPRSPPCVKSARR